MTLPFENDTSRIVKKYAKHSISQSRVKTFLSVLTIALAVALLSGFALSVIGMETEAKRELLVSSQMLYHNLNDEQMQTLRHDERISDSKIYMQAANTQIENYLVIPVYIEQNNSQIVMDEIVEGQYPIDLYDVAVDKAYLEQLGLPVELGVTITIPFYDGNTENFTVVGLTDSGSTERVYSLFCSKQYTEAGSQFQHSVTALAVQFAHADEMSKQVFEAMTKQIEADYGIPAQNSDPNDGFLSSLEPNWEDIQIVMIFSFAVLFVSYLVIYSIFYIYVHNQVREFGQLRTMGTGNVKKCAVGKHPKSEKHGNTAQFSEVERSGTQENCGGIESGCLLRLHPLPVPRRRQPKRVACIDPDAVVVDKNIAKNDRFDLFSR